MMEMRPPHAREELYFEDSKLVARNPKHNKQMIWYLVRW